MFMKNKLKILFISIFSLLFIMSCNNDSKTELMPKDETDEQAILNQTETVLVDSVEVTVSSDAWAGTEKIKEKVTPLRISVKNNNDKPIEITYENLSLVTNDGDVYAALPIYNVRGDKTEAELIKEDTITVTSQIEFDKFYIYPMYTHAVNNVPISHYDYFGEQSYYQKYYADWNDENMPTAVMRNLALPEGTLDKGGSISGFVYFQKVDPDLRQITLKMNIVNAENNELLGKVEIPLWVMYERDN